MKLLFLTLMSSAALSLAGPAAASVDYVILHEPIDFEHPIRTELHPRDVTGTYQQIFSASLFSTLGPGGGLIREIDLYTSAFFHDFADGTAKGFSVELSVVSEDPGALSPVFAANLGSKVTLFNDPSLSIGVVANNDPGGASVAIVGLGKPFRYDPALGNLLVQITGLNTPPQRSGDHEGDDLPLDAVRGSAFTSAVWSSVPGATSGRITGDALVMGFRFFPVPEPTPVALLASAAIGSAALGIRFRKPNGSDVRGG